MMTDDIEERIRYARESARRMNDYWNDQISASELVANILPQYRQNLEAVLIIHITEVTANDLKKHGSLPESSNDLSDFVAKILKKKNGITEALRQAGYGTQGVRK